jgi:hypothetical protein
MVFLLNWRHDTQVLQCNVSQHKQSCDQGKQLIVEQIYPIFRANKFIQFMETLPCYDVRETHSRHSKQCLALQGFLLLLVIMNIPKTNLIHKDVNFFQSFKIFTFLDLNNFELWWISIIFEILWKKYHF